MTEHFEPSTKKGRGRGMAQRSLDLIEAMYAAAEAAQPITGRGVGYKLFSAGMIPSMARADMRRVYRLLKEALDPNDLRDCVEQEIKKLIEPVAWKRCEIVNRAEQDSLKTILEKWGAPRARDD